MFDAGVRAEAERALAGPVSSTAAYAHGLSDIAEHADDDAAIEALTARTRRYAAYQRKWMRRIPGLVSLPADPPLGEVVDAISKWHGSATITRWSSGLSLPCR